MDLGAIAIKGYSAFSKAPASVSDCLVSYPGHSLRGGGVFLLCRDAVAIFYSFNWLGTKTLVGGGKESSPSAEMQLVYSTVPPANWVTKTLVGGESYPSAETQLVYSTVSPANWATKTLVWGEVLPLSRDAVGVFYSSTSQLGHQDTCWGWVLTLCRDAVIVFYSPASQLGLDSIGVFQTVSTGLQIFLILMSSTDRVFHLTSSPISWGIGRLQLWREVLPPTMSVLRMTLTCIW